eukprot:scaffold17728_cov62-Phaeocystis_antarctica.AAC.2
MARAGESRARGSSCAAVVGASRVSCHRTCCVEFDLRAPSCLFSPSAPLRLPDALVRGIALNRACSNGTRSRAHLRSHGRFPGQGRFRRRATRRAQRERQTDRRQGAGPGGAAEARCDLGGVAAARGGGDGAARARAHH